MKYLIYVLIIFNVISFLQFGIDKYKSIKNKWRISEKTLILSAFFMGRAGSLLGMIVFHHKTKHIKFKILIPLAFVVNIVVIIGGYYLATGKI
jgi:uncharacterized membrane protein YsdA (DUF1294 family)